MRSRRHQLGLTATQLGYEIGRSPYTVNDYERDRQEPPASVARAIAIALDMDMDDLFTSVATDDDQSEATDETVAVT
jgi:transcriptional regulator with XRE-family HTH domain